MKKICFVIQPFNEKFNQRYADIIKPAIEECGLVPYKVDEDENVIIPIESIHNSIKKSCICVAEITTNNPNVWYEVGYAMALDIPIILVCSDERDEAYPFDVRHRNILQYKTRSLKDYNEYKNRLITRISLNINPNPNEIITDLTEEEGKILCLIAKIQMSPNQVITQQDIQNDGGLNKEKYIFVLRKLISVGFIQYIYAVENGNVNGYYQLTEKGEQWICKNT